MTQGQGSGGKKPPTDDRTLLDPLSNDELQALREARQRMQAKKSGPVAHQAVVGPDGGEDIGDAPTRAMPALPTFDAGVSLDQISGQRPVDAGVKPTQPMSILGPQTVPANSPPVVQVPNAHPLSGMPGIGPGGPVAGPTGFGENTLLWMQPPKIAEQSANLSDILPKATKQEVAKARLRTAGVAFAIALVVGGLLFVALAGGKTGVIELHTTPPKARVKVDGKSYNEVTPVRLTLPSGEHVIALELDGHAPHEFTAQVQASEEAQRKEVELEPLSQPGMLTVTVDVQPVAANITVDQKLYASKRSIKIPNLDPNQPHKIVVEAGGYVKIEQEVTAGQLKGGYSFVLQQDPNAKP